MHKLWSKRWSVSYGWKWKLEHECETREEVERWLDVYRDDEPRVEFRISPTKPRI